MKALLVKPLSIIVLGIVAAMAMMISCKDQEPPPPMNRVERLAASINFKCPFMVDVDTRMDSVNILPDSTFQYNYTLVNQVRDRIDIRGLTIYMWSELLETVRFSSTMKLHRDHHLRLVFHYRDKNGEFVTEIVISPEDYE